MGENEWSSEQPLRGIRKVIDECDGVVVIAFSRSYFSNGTEIGGSDTSIILENLHLPTVWNQVEATMGYMKDLPLLIIAERGLKEEGLIKDGYDWSVFWTDFSAEHLRSEAFLGFLKSWNDQVSKHWKTRLESGQNNRLDLSKISITQIAGSLTLGQFLKTGGVLFSLASGVAAVAYGFGAGKWPW